MATFGLFSNMGAFPGLSHQEILDAAISYAEAAEQLGYHDVWVSEHHFIPFGICPSALTMAGFLLGRTRRLRVGTATTLVHLYHPLQLAEQAALLDQLSGRRFDFGIGRGGYLLANIDVREPSRQCLDRPAGRAEVGVVEVLPAERRGDRRAGLGP